MPCYRQDVKRAPSSRKARSTRTTPNPRLAADAHRSSGVWQTVPEGLELTWLQLDGERIAVLSYPLVARVPLDALTEAERDIVDLVLAGSSNADVAARRGTSPRTVANQ